MHTGVSFKYIYYVLDSILSQIEILQWWKNLHFHTYQYQYICTEGFQHGTYFELLNWLLILVWELI